MSSSSLPLILLIVREQGAMLENSCQSWGLGVCCDQSTLHEGLDGSQRLQEIQLGQPFLPATSRFLRERVGAGRLNGSVPSAEGSDEHPHQQAPNLPIISL